MQTMREPEYDREELDYLARLRRSRREQAEKAQLELESESQLKPPPTFTGKKITTTVLLKLLRAAFDDEELTTLCFEHFRRVYDDKFAYGMGRLVKIRLLTEYCERHGEVDKLLNLIKELNPHQYYQHMIGSLNEDVQPLNENIGSDRSKVEIVIPFPLPSFTPELKLAVIGAIADALNILPTYIKVLAVREGSIILHLEMPKWAVHQLIAWYRTGHPIINDLGIKQVRLIDNVPKKDATYISPKIRKKPQNVRSGEFFLGERLLTDVIIFLAKFYWKTFIEVVRNIPKKFWDWLNDKSE